MKKLFVSVPMKDRTYEDIEKTIEAMKTIAELHFGEKLEVIKTHTNYDVAENIMHKSIYYLGHSITAMADADYYIGLDWTGPYNGCAVENRVADLYNIPKLLITGEGASFLQDCKYFSITSSIVSSNTKKLL